MRLIDADALMRTRWVLPNRMTRETALECFGNIVNEAPTIEAEPVRHGIWLKNDLGQTYCSICQRQIPTVPQLYIECGDFEEDTEIEETEYCPNCGAKMGGGKRDV